MQEMSAFVRSLHKRIPRYFAGGMDPCDFLAVMKTTENWKTGSALLQSTPMKDYFWQKRLLQLIVAFLPVNIFLPQGYTTISPS